jgi:serine/threonine protein phosphatase 1
MQYVMSDIHGCRDSFYRLLSKIGFGSGDALYILGDVLDRGPDGVRLLLELEGLDGVTLLRGNHEHTVLMLLRQAAHGTLQRAMQAAWRLWLSDGGQCTWDAFCALSAQEQLRVLSYLDSLPLFAELTAAGRSFFLSHTGPSRRKMCDLDNCHMRDLFFGEIEYEKRYFDDCIFISGHTPTQLIDPAYAGRVWRGNGHIAIDCGAAYGGRLACVCLETLEEFYCPGQA